MSTNRSAGLALYKQTTSAPNNVSDNSRTCIKAVLRSWFSRVRISACRFSIKTAWSAMPDFLCDSTSSGLRITNSFSSLEESVKIRTVTGINGCFLWRRSAGLLCPLTGSVSFRLGRMDFMGFPRRSFSPRFVNKYRGLFAMRISSFRRLYITAGSGIKFINVRMLCIPSVWVNSKPARFSGRFWVTLDSSSCELLDST